MGVGTDNIACLCFGPWSSRILQTSFISFLGGQVFHYYANFLRDKIVGKRQQKIDMEVKRKCRAAAIVIQVKGGVCASVCTWQWVCVWLGCV
jgi:hypothetical protein